MNAGELIDNAAWPLCSLLVSQQHKAIFTPVAKSANTSLKRLFVRLSGHPQSEEILNSDVHVYLTTHKTGLSLCDYDQEEATGILADPDYFSFVVLRNPAIRVVSAYLDKFVRNPHYSEAPGVPPIVTGGAITWVYQQRSEEPDYNRSITFREFVEYIAHAEDAALDTHFKSQACYLEDQRPDYIGTVEKMHELPGHLEPVFNQAIEIEHIHKVERRKSSFLRGKKDNILPARLRSEIPLPHPNELLSHELMEKIQNRFARDFELWHTAMGE